VRSTLADFKLRLERHHVLRTARAISSSVRAGIREVEFIAQGLLLLEARRRICASPATPGVRCGGWK